MTWWQIDAQYQKRVAAAANDFRSLLDSDNIETAVSYRDRLQQLDPNVAAASPITALDGQLQTKLRAEQERVTQFANYLAEADAENDADIDLTALHRAEERAKTEEEKGRVFSLRQRQTHWEQNLVTKQTEDLLANIAALRKRLDQIETGDANDVAIAGLGTVLDETQALSGTFPRASNTAKSQVTSVRTRAISMRDAIKSQLLRIETEDRAMASIFSAKSLDQFERALTSFASRSSDSPSAAEFKRVANERELWTKALSWNVGVEAVVRSIQSPFNAQLVEAVIKQREEIDNVIDQSPLALPANVTERFERHEQRKDIALQILGSLPETVIADLYTVVESDGEGDRYFINKDYYDRMRKVRFIPFSDSEKSKSRSIEIVANESGAVSTKLLTGEYVVLKEPHATVQSMLSNYQTEREKFLSDWEGEFLKLMASLRTRADLDSQIKEMLLQHLLGGACQGSDYLASNLVDELRFMKSRSVEFATWYEPTKLDRSLDAVIEGAVVPRLAKLYSQRPNAVMNLSEIQKQQYHWVGMLIRQSGGKIGFKALNQSEWGDDQSAKPFNLAIARPSPRDSDKVDLVPIGEWSGGEARLTLSQSDWVSGRPVFAYPK